MATETLELFVTVISLEFESFVIDNMLLPVFPAEAIAIAFAPQ